MADFDNGLPAQGTGISGSNIAIVTVEKSDIESEGNNVINAVAINETDAEEHESSIIHSLSINTNVAGRNNIMYL